MEVTQIFRRVTRDNKTNIDKLMWSAGYITPFTKHTYRDSVVTVYLGFFVSWMLIAFIAYELYEAVKMLVENLK